MPTDRDAFNAAMGRVEALTAAQRLAVRFDELCYEVGHRGPLAIYGCFLRDIALARDPVCLQVALDGGLVNSDMFTALVNMASTLDHAAPVPDKIDIRVFRRDALLDAGYAPQLTNDRFNQETFLKAVIRLVPVRINALGATPHGTLHHPEWDYDAYYNRFVVRYGGHDDATRPEESLEVLTTGKYPNWKIQYERADGDLTDEPTNDSEGDAEHRVLGH